MHRQGLGQARLPLLLGPSPGRPQVLHLKHKDICGERALQWELHNGGFTVLGKVGTGERRLAPSPPGRSTCLSLKKKKRIGDPKTCLLQFSPQKEFRNYTYSILLKLLNIPPSKSYSSCSGLSLRLQSPLTALVRVMGPTSARPSPRNFSTNRRRYSFSRTCLC